MYKVKGGCHCGTISYVAEFPKQLHTYTRACDCTLCKSHGAAYASDSEKPAFRSAFRRRRCLVPASGYFEWRTESGAKQPYCIRPAEALLPVFAGLYEHWRDRQGEGVDSCTILVNEAAPSLTHIHDRMPVCLDMAQIAAWLDPGLLDPVQLQELIRHPARPELAIFSVTRHINNPRYNAPDAISTMS